MNILNKILLTMALALSVGAYAQQFTPAQKQYFAIENLLTNPGLENGKASWTCAAGTFTSDSTGKIDGNYAGKVVLSSQTLDCSITVPTNTSLQGSAALILQALKSSIAGIEVCPIVDSTVQTSACSPYDGSDILKEVAPLNPYFGATNIGLKIRTAGAVTGTVFFDGSKVSRLSANQTSIFSQPGLVGTFQYARTAGCTFSNAATSFANFAAQASCPTATVTGVVTAPGTKIPGFVMTPKAGTYRIVARSRYVPSASTVAATIAFRITDGTLFSGHATMSSTGIINAGIGANNHANGLEATFTYTAASSSALTYQIQSSTTSGSNSATIQAASGDVEYDGLLFEIYYYPPASAVMANYYPWKIDVNLGGANPSLGLVAVSSYTEITNAGLDMVINEGSALARPVCATTNASTQISTCAAGNEGVGVNIPSLPYPGDYRVCMDFIHYLSQNANAVSNTTYQLVWTSNASQTILKEGQTRVGAAGNIVSSNADIGYPTKICGTFNFTDTSEKTIRLMYEQSISGTIGNIDIKADRSATIGQRDIHITVEPITPYMVAGLASYVSTPGELKPKTYSAYVSAAGVVSEEIGDIVNGNCSVSGTSIYDCPVNTAVGATQKLNCNITADVTLGDTIGFGYDRTNSTTSNLKFNTKNSTSGAALARPFNFSCHVK